MFQSLYGSSLFYILAGRKIRNCDVQLFCCESNKKKITCLSAGKQNICNGAHKTMEVFYFQKKKKKRMFLF